MTEISKNMECPVCKGEGIIALPKKNKDKAQRKIQMAQTLVEAGFTYAEVSEVLDYKSRSSVSHAIKQIK